MVDQATERTTIMASPQDCFAIATDFERYPSWAADIKQAKVLERDESGRAVDVEYHVSAMGRSATYTLRYFYGTDPLRMAWRLQSSEIATRLDGEYEFRPVTAIDNDLGGNDLGDNDLGDDGTGTEATTEVIYHLAVELTIPLPGFLKRRAETRIMHTALDELKAHVESTVGS